MKIHTRLNPENFDQQVKGFRGIYFLKNVKIIQMHDIYDMGTQESC